MVLQSLNGYIRFEDVTFRYDPEGTMSFRTSISSSSRDSG
jgi:ABC-type bacteriocin/lantibiotic exporter with double-glycine peptidase domain